MFEPGHLHLAHDAVQPKELSFHIDLRYDIVQDPEQGSCLHVHMTGDIAGDRFDDEFLLPKDQFFNFASRAERIARKHGLPPAQVLPVSLHRQYDAMFEDIRQRLNAHSGDPVKPEHLQ